MCRCMMSRLPYAADCLMLQYVAARGEMCRMPQRHIAPAPAAVMRKQPMPPMQDERCAMRAAELQVQCLMQDALLRCRAPCRADARDMRR